MKLGYVWLTKELIQSTIKNHKTYKSTCQALGVDKSTLRKYMRKYGLYAPIARVSVSASELSDAMKSHTSVKAASSAIGVSYRKARATAILAGIMPSRPIKKLTKKEIVEAFDKFVLSADIMCYLGISHSTLMRKAKKFGIWIPEVKRIHARLLTEEVLLEELKHHGASDIAKKFNVSVHAVKAGLVKYNINSSAKKTERTKKRKISYMINLYKLSDNPKASSSTIRNHVLALVDYRCVSCGVSEYWNGCKIVLQMDHIDGDRQNNRLTNLRLLCPNCHSQTPTFGSRNTKRKRAHQQHSQNTVEA